MEGSVFGFGHRAQPCEPHLFLLNLVALSKTRADAPSGLGMPRHQKIPSQKIRQHDNDTDGDSKVATFGSDMQQ